MTGPKINEKWNIGTYKGLIFLGIGYNFAQQKYFIFKDGNDMFVITKDEFYSAEQSKQRMDA